MIENALEGLGEIIASIIAALFNTLFSPIFDILSGFEEYIFGLQDDNMVYSTFSQDDMVGVIAPGMNMFTVISVTFLVAGVIYSGYHISKSGINPSNRSAVIQSLTDWLIVGFLLANLGTIFDVIFTANGAIVSFFEQNYTPMLENGTNLNPIDDLLYWILIQFVQIGLGIWAMMYYAMRALSLMILVIASPLIVTLWLFPQTKSITLSWFKEIIGITFVQSIHAALFWIITSSTLTASGDSDIDLKHLLMMIIFIPTGEAIKGLLGMGGSLHGAMNKTGAMFGLSALAGAYGSVKGALGDKGVMESIKSAGSKALDQRKKGSATDSSNTGIQGEALSPTSRGERMLRAGEIMSKGGKMFGGVAGSFIGSPMGPAGSIAGATAGSIVGDVTGGVSGRIGYGPASTLKRSLKDGISEMKNDVSKGQLADLMAENKLDQWAHDENGGLKKLQDIKSRGFAGDELDKVWDAEKRNQHNAFRREAQDNLEGLIDRGGVIGQSGKVNTEAVSRHVASQMTEKQKSQQMNADMANGMTNDQALEKWNNIEPQQYDKNLMDARSIVPDKAKADLSNANKIIQHGAVGLQGAGGFIKGTTKGFVEHSGAKELYEDIKDSKIGAAATGAVAGFKQGYLSETIGNEMVGSSNVVFNSVSGMKSGSVEAVKQGFNNFVEHQVDDPIERHEDSRNRQAYTSGTVMGRTGYLKSAQRVEQKGRFKEAAEHQALEVGEIATQVQTKKVFNPASRKNEVYIADEALQMVVTNDQSYIQMTDTKGDTKVGSQIGTGDPLIKAGEKVFQNLDIQDSQIVSTNQFHKIDSSGGKITVSRQPSINPNSLIGNKATKFKETKFDEYIPFNHNVDSRQFTISEIATNNGSNKVEQIVERDKSYLVMKDKSGQSYRVSPYGKGDSSLKINQRYSTTYNIKDNSLVKGNHIESVTKLITSTEEKEVQYTPRQDPNDLIPLRPNRRYLKREQLDQQRSKFIGV
ncbi:hypothetical protein [Bacillus sp. SM2101]|uniref:hypothetical protein n=1 Tax=Bacillus sp. SM2101 TaxID=2805366 RepID=UPI001BDF22E8|nr:hypothetical protein [Bacillus sp. SM2101]